MKHRESHAATSARPALSVILALLLAGPALAWADTALAPPGGAATSQTPDVATQAKAHYELGITAYELGHYDRAIEAFTQAHALDPASVLLYNIAQAYWKKGDNAEAAAFYRRYLDADPHAPGRAKIRARIRELEGGKPQGAGPETAEKTRRNEPVAPPPVAARESAAPAAAGESLTSATLPPGGTAARDPRNLVLTAPPEINLHVPERDQVVITRPGPPIYRRPWFWPAIGAAGLITLATIFLVQPDDRSWTCGPECRGTRDVP